MMIGVKKKIENLDIKKEFKLGWNYLKSSKKYVFIAFFIFIVSIFLGYFSLLPGIPHISYEKFNGFPLSQEKYISNINEPIRIDYIDFFKDFIGYFLNNIFADIIGIFGGISFGLIPFRGLILNGALTGFVISFYQGSVFYFVCPLIHGLFEFPALFISSGIGLKLGTSLFRKKKWEALNNYLWNSLRVFIFIVLPLTLIAALIEPFSFEIVKFFYQMFN